MRTQNNSALALKKLKRHPRWKTAGELPNKDEFFRRLENSGLHAKRSLSFLVLHLPDLPVLYAQEGRFTRRQILRDIAALVHRCHALGAQVGTLDDSRFVLASPLAAREAQAFAEILQKQIFQEMCVMVHVGAGRTLGMAQKALQ